MCSPLGVSDGRVTQMSDSPGASRASRGAMGYQDLQYETRCEILKAADFDPRANISLDENRCWQWSSEKPGLHRKVREYFWSRGEQDPAHAAERC